MHHYPHHIGDFNSATRHLTRVEKSIYRDLIELYYDTEEPLTSDISALCRKIIAVTEEELTAVQQVLTEFFTAVNDCYFHIRCQDVINIYQASIKNKKKAGKASVKARKIAKLMKDKNKEKEINPLTPAQHPLNTRSTGVHNQEPITNNQEPVTNNQSLKEICNKEKLPDKELIEKYRDTAFDLFYAWKDLSESKTPAFGQSECFAVMRLLETGVTYEDLIAKIGAITNSCKAFGDEHPGLESICTNYQPPPDC